MKIIFKKAYVQQLMANEPQITTMPQTEPKILHPFFGTPHMLYQYILVHSKVKTALDLNDQHTSKEKKDADTLENFHILLLTRDFSLSQSKSRL